MFSIQQKTIGYDQPNREKFNAGSLPLYKRLIIMKNTIEFTRINNDINGNPRYVCHFLSFINDNDRVLAEKFEQTCKPFQFSISHMYDIALAKSRKIGGRKFHNKQYGGGIVFQSYSLPELEKSINEVKNK